MDTIKLQQIPPTNYYFELRDVEYEYKENPLDLMYGKIWMVDPETDTSAYIGEITGGDCEFEVSCDNHLRKNLQEFLPAASDQLITDLWLGLSTRSAEHAAVCITRMARAAGELFEKHST